MFYRFPRNIKLTIQFISTVNRRPTLNKYLSYNWLNFSCISTQGRRINGDISPSQQYKAFSMYHFFNQRFRNPSSFIIRRQKNHPDPISLLVWKFYTDSSTFLLEKGMRHLNQYTSPISRIRIATTGAPMTKVFQNLEGLFYDRVRFPTLDVRNHTDPTTVVFQLWGIKTGFCQLL